MNKIPNVLRELEGAYNEALDLQERNRELEGKVSALEAIVTALKANHMNRKEKESELESQVKERDNRIRELEQRLNDIDMKRGVIYLVEIPEKDNPSLFKIGLTKDHFRMSRLLAYGPNRIELRLIEMPLYELMEYEQALKDAFRKTEGLTIAKGCEYFYGSREIATCAFDAFFVTMAGKIPTLQRVCFKKTLRRRNRGYLPEEVDDDKVDDDIPELPGDLRTKKVEIDWRAEFVPTTQNETYWSQYKGEDREVLVCAFERTKRVASAMEVPYDRVDRRFFEEYVLPRNVVHGFRTLLYTFGSTYSCNLERMQYKLRKLQEGKTEKDSNMELREWVVKKQYIVQLIGQQILETVLSTEEYNKVRTAFDDGNVSRKVVEKWVTDFLNSLSATEEKNLARLLNVQKLPKQKPLACANLFLKRAFDTTIIPVSSNANSKSKAYDRMKLDMTAWKRLITEFKSDILDE